MSAANKTLVRWFYEEVVNQGNMAAADELMTPDYVEHGHPAGETGGLEVFKQFVAGLAVVFPD